MIGALGRAVLFVRDFCTNPLRIEQVITALKAFAVIGAFAFSVYLLHIYVYSVHISQPPLSLAVAFLTAQGAAIGSQLVGSCLVKKLTAMNTRLSAERAPAIRGRLAAYAVGVNGIGELRTVRRLSPRTFEQCLLQMLAAVEGVTKSRLTVLASELGILHSWEVRARHGDAEGRQFAAECFGLLAREESAPRLRGMLDDNSPVVRGTAFRSILRTAEDSEVSQLLHRIGEHPYLVRVFAAGELRNRALAIDLPSLSRSLNQQDSANLIGMLNIVEGWRRPLPPESILALLEHHDPRARSAAIRLAPVSLAGAAAVRWTLDALQSEDDLIRRAGLAGAAQLSLASAIPLMERCAESANLDLAALACIALSRVGPRGRGRLENMLATGFGHQAAFAAQALSGAAMATPFPDLQ
jgi:hypothetical protein